MRISILAYDKSFQTVTIVMDGFPIVWMVVTTPLTCQGVGLRYMNMPIVRFQSIPFVSDKQVFCPWMKTKRQLSPPSTPTPLQALYESSVKT